MLQLVAPVERRTNITKNTNTVSNTGIAASTCRDTGIDPEKCKAIYENDLPWFHKIHPGGLTILVEDLGFAGEDAS